MDSGTWRTWLFWDVGTQVPGCKAEKIIHGVGMVLEATGLLKELEGGDAKSLWGDNSH